MIKIEKNCKKYNCIYYEEIFYNYYCKQREHGDYIKCLKTNNSMFHNKSDIDLTLFNICRCGEVIFNHQYFCYKCFFILKNIVRVSCTRCDYIFFMSDPYFYDERVGKDGRLYKKIAYKSNTCPNYSNHAFDL